MMNTKLDSNINAGYPLGKGEVVSSILTGSTSYPREIDTSGIAPITYSAVAGRPERERDTSTRGKSVEFVQAAFALCRWAKGKPWDVRMNVLIAVLNLRRLAQRDTPENRENAISALSRLQT